MDIATESGNSVRPLRRFHRLPVCVVIFVILFVWLWIWPFTGDGDSALHYQNFRESAVKPVSLLSAWARPVYAAVMVIPALGGIVVVRGYTALLSTVLVWQTMRMADDLKLPNATMAGLFVLWQPLAFALASDTMTEMPMALGIVLAVRLWWAQRRVISCLLVSFLPMVRPEGFFLIVLWGLMTLFAPDRSFPMKRRITTCLLLGTGVFCWLVASKMLAGDALYFVRYWPWPAESFPWYNDRERPLLHHFANWPLYCGPVLFPLFLLGAMPSLKRSMWLPLTIWAIVILVHSILFWGGWFAALGLMRIIACTSAVTALICLFGWNLAADWSRRFRVPTSIRWTGAVLTFGVGSVTPMLCYAANGQNHRCFPLIAAARFVEQNGLLAEAPRFFVGDKIVLGALDYPVFSDQFIENQWNREDQHAMLGGLPPGSIGVWDNQQSAVWFSTSIEALETLGYDVIFEQRQRIPASWFGVACSRAWAEDHRVVVVRKQRE